MECNRDEATRAKEIAEKKFTAKDILGSKKFALKAQTLYSGLEGIQKMLATLEVYISAENKISGEADWYGVLGVNPLADEETMRKQYKTLALMLHPDKNKSVGAGGAFNLISEAWSLLSDKAKRLAYDHKRSAKKFQQKVPAPTGTDGYSFTKSSTPCVRVPKGESTKMGTSSVPVSTPSGTDSNSFTKSSTPFVRVPKSESTKMGASSVPVSSHKQKPATFWTVCDKCKKRFEYVRMYLNRNLVCPNCHQGFFSIETTPPPSNGSKTSKPSNYDQKRQNSNHQRVNKNVSNPRRNNTSTSNVGSGGFGGPDLSTHAKMDASSVPVSPHKKKPATYWTTCDKCKKRHEYVRMYLNRNLVCPNCHQVFFSIETTPLPLTGAEASSQSSYHQKRQKQII